MVGSAVAVGWILPGTAVSTVRKSSAANRWKEVNETATQANQRRRIESLRPQTGGERRETSGFVGLTPMPAKGLADAGSGGYRLPRHGGQTGSRSSRPRPPHQYRCEHRRRHGEPGPAEILPAERHSRRTPAPASASRLAS